MLIRIWKVRILKDRTEDLRDFARTESLPMFKKQAGCLGVLFTLDGNLCATISVWKDRRSIESLKTSQSYKETVDKILATGMLEDEQSVEIFDCFGGYLDLAAIAQIVHS